MVWAQVCVKDHEKGCDRKQTRRESFDRSWILEKSYNMVNLICSGSSQQPSTILKKNKVAVPHGILNPTSTAPVEIDLLSKSTFLKRLFSGKI